MLRGQRVITAACALLCGTALAVTSAQAKCTRLAFSVNDYGKDGPIKDAKSLLDKYIAEWTAQRGIAKYNVGKKDVSCELFLDFIVFDEHTCKAEATVCWSGDEKLAVQPGSAAPATVTTGAVPALKAPPAPAAAKPAAPKAQ